MVWLNGLVGWLSGLVGWLVGTSFRTFVFLSFEGHV